MTDERRLTFYHAPNTRSTGIRVLLEELAVPYDLHLLDMKAGELRQPAYLAINPMGKVPAIRHGEALVTEQIAITIYLADFFSEAGLAPGITDPLRGPYLRWLAFYAGAFEPAIIDRAQQREPTSAAMSPYGDFDTMFSTLLGQLGDGPYILGDRFTAADVIWGSALGWTLAFKLVPPLPQITAYVQRFAERPATIRARAADAAQ